MKVAAIIVTRGDVEITPVLRSLLDSKVFSEIIYWDNSGTVRVEVDEIPELRCVSPDQDLSVYGRYAAIAYTDADLIYVQDDDCIVSDPQALVREWFAAATPSAVVPATPDYIVYEKAEHVVCNMPPEFRHDFYTDHALVGFGAVFHRDAPQRAFERFTNAIAQRFTAPYAENETEFFRRTCDIVFTALTPRVLVDVPKTNLWWAEDESRMYRQPQHVEERLRMLELVKKVRDAS